MIESAPAGENQIQGGRKIVQACPEKDNLIEEVVADAKRLRNDFVEELVDRGILVTEVMA